MSKKLFKQLVKKASTPVPKEQDKQLHPEGYNGKQISHRELDKSYPWYSR